MKRKSATRRTRRQAERRGGRIREREEDGEIIYSIVTNGAEYESNDRDLLLEYLDMGF